MVCAPPRGPRYSIRIRCEKKGLAAPGTAQRIVALLDGAGLDAPTLPEVGEQLQLGRDTMTRALRELSLNRSIVKVERDVALSAAAEAHARELVAAAIAAAAPPPLGQPAAQPPRACCARPWVCRANAPSASWST